MKDKIAAVCIFAIAGAFLFSGVTCFTHGLYFETFWQGFACSMFIIAGIQEWRK